MQWNKQLRIGWNLGNICETEFGCGIAVVDGPEAEAVVEKALRNEAVKAILSGAAVFFPDKHSRREKLFHMMVRLAKNIYIS